MRHAALGMGRGGGRRGGKVVGLAHGIVQGWCWNARVVLTVTVDLERFDSQMRWGGGRVDIKAADEDLCVSKRRM